MFESKKPFLYKSNTGNPAACWGTNTFNTFMLQMIKKRLGALKNRQDFKKNPLMALWKRLVWHARWKCLSHPWTLTHKDGSKISAPRGGAGALIYYQGESEPKTNRFLKSFLKSGMIFWDIGAHIGEHTLLSAKAVGMEGEVHAFEPSPEIFSILKSNVHLNQLDNVFLNLLAVSDTSKETIFEVFDEPAISRLMHKNPSKNATKRISVQCVSLDQYRKGKRQPNLIKIDVEGAELEALKGMVNLLALNSEIAPTLILEYVQTNSQNFSYQSTALITFLSNFGFNFYWLSDNTLMPLDLKDSIFQFPENNLIASKSNPCLYLD